MGFLDEIASGGPISFPSIAIPSLGIGTGESPVEIAQNIIEGTASLPSAVFSEATVEAAEEKVAASRIFGFKPKTVLIALGLAGALGLIIMLR